MGRWPPKWCAACLRTARSWPWPSAPTTTSWRAAAGQLVRRVASPFNPGQTVGEIVLVPDPAAVSKGVADDVKFVSVMLGSQWLAIGGGLLILVLMSVVRPIKTISDRLHRMDAEGGEQLAVPVGQERTEIGRLVADINALAGRLVAAIHHANEQTRQLQAAKEQVDAQAGQLAAKNAALGQAMRVREEVERIARHDLKTPLNSIAAIPALLRRNWRPGEDEEALLAMIENSARRVLRMVSLSLDLARMEEGSYVFHPKAVDIAALALAVIRDLAEEARAKRIDFEMAALAPRIFVQGEETLCYSILANLLDNAVEAAPAGSAVGISIRAGDSVRIEIHNAGAVPPPVRETFFEKYATFGKSRGTGLGTYSARLMAHVQGGELVMATSEAGGTTLTLSLAPLPAPETPAAGAVPAVPAPALPGTQAAIPPLRVLLVDDDPDNMLIMKLQLPAPPLQVEAAGNGGEAVEACRRRRPDIIFMDLEMPVMDGFEALRRIRAGQAGRGEAPSRIVAFSAHDDEASRQRSILAGFDLHLSKPSSQAEILAVLAGVRGGGAAAAALPEDLVRVDEDLLSAIPGFLASRRAVAADLRQSLADGDRERLRRVAHKLKGSLGLYGFTYGAAICSGLEVDCRNAASASLNARIDALEQYLAQATVCSRSRPRRLSP